MYTQLIKVTVKFLGEKFFSGTSKSAPVLNPVRTKQITLKPVYQCLSVCFCVFVVCVTVYLSISSPQNGKHLAGRSIGITR